MTLLEHGGSGIRIMAEKKVNPLQNVVAPEQFDFQAEKWQTWKKRFVRYMEISGNDAREGKVKINLLIYLMGGRAEELLKQLNLSESENYEGVLQAFELYFNPRKNVIYERVKFNMRNQGINESINEYVTDLYKLAETCEYEGLREGLIRDRLIVGMLDRKASERLQLMYGLTLEEAINLAKQAEEQREKSKMLYREENYLEVNKMEKRQNKRCWWCGKFKMHSKEQCPAAKINCYKCNKVGHYAKCCKDWKKVNYMDSTDADFRANIEVCFDKFKTVIKFLVDTGADIVAIPLSYVKSLSNDLTPCGEVIRGPDGKSLQVLGWIVANLKFRGHCYSGKMYVIKDLKTPILGRPAIRKMNIILNLFNIGMENSILKVNEIEKMYPGIFDDLGVFKDKFAITLVDNPKPFVQTAPRVVPIPLLGKVKQELDTMVKKGIVSPIEEPTMFVSPIVVVPKGKDGVRICGDYTAVNKNILRPIFPIHKVELTLARLKGAKVFSKIDATSGFFQIPLNDESKKVTTILTPFGRFMYNRLPMGLNCAPEYFSMKFSNLFSDLEGVVIHVDDVLLYTKDRESHHKLLKEVLFRLHKEGLTINKEKCVFGVEKVTYLGHTISAEGIALDPERVDSIKQFKIPTNKKQLMQFLGLVNYVGRFIPNKTNILEPLNELLKDKVLFRWDMVHDMAFNKIKDSIQNAPALKHYDPNKKIIISADSSSYGLGAVLLQENKDGSREVVCYASRTLNNSERNYAQIEKECLALSWAVNKFRDYIVGIELTLETDHKPLVQILQTKPLDDLTPRLLRFRLQLMRYPYVVTYVPGKTLVVADALSRMPLKDTQTGTEKLTINLIGSGHTDKKLNKIREEQLKCELCKTLRDYTLNGWPRKCKVLGNVSDYYQYRQNFSVQDDLILYNSRILIPASLQKQTLMDLHKGHLGITKCRERAKQSVWWKGLSSQIKLLINNCPECVEERINLKEPMVVEEMPTRAWQKIGIDLFKYDGKWYILFIDYYSRYIDMFLLKELTETCVIQICKETFARFGIPEVVRTDCGTQFKSKFQEFASAYNFDHITSSPYYSQSNGCAEAGVKIAKALLKKNSDIHLALLSYRNTPMECGYSPNELLFNRKCRETIPMHPDKLKVNTNIHKDFISKKNVNRNKMAKYYNNKHGAVPLSDLNTGDSVWIIDLRRYGVIVRKAKELRSYFVRSEGTTYRRNRWHLIPAPFYSDPAQSSFEEEIIVTESNKGKVPNNFSNGYQSDRNSITNEEDFAGQNDDDEVIHESREGPLNSHRCSSRIRTKPSWCKDYVMG